MLPVKWKQIALAPVMILCLAACNKPAQHEITPAILPVPKQASLSGGNTCFTDSILIYTGNDSLEKLVDVLKEELRSMTGVRVVQTRQKEKADWIIDIEPSLPEEAYTIDADEQIKITGAGYSAAAMASVTVLQAMQANEGSVCVPKMSVSDHPDHHYRGLLIDLARRKHDLASLKRMVLLCRWYKINYLQLHLTDDQSFTFPSVVFPQLVTEASHFTESELSELVEYAYARGVELVPEFDVPGHSGQAMQKLPSLFGFTNKALNRSTINMADERVYAALDTLIGEIARIFHRSRYIHIGGDETDFSGMAEDQQVAAYLQHHGLKNIEALYWYFINRMNEAVKKRGKKTIVWEGFSKEGNTVINKDITVMAWETIYQLPQDLLDAGFTIINVSWKPLYVVNEKKWDPLDIYHWNIYHWGNWVPKMPSFTPMQLPPHSHVMGASMASWDQPAYTEVSSLRNRIPAMVEKIWNPGSAMDDAVFLSLLAKTDSAFGRYLSPVTRRTDGLSHPGITDGRYDEQTRFDDKIMITLSAPRNLEIRYSVDGAAVTNASAVYQQPIKRSTTTELRYRAFDKDLPAGEELLDYYELYPLEVTLSGTYTISPDSLWETTRSWLIGFTDSMQVGLGAKRKGDIRYVTGEKELNSRSPLYRAPFAVKDTTVIKAGLFTGDSLTGRPWIQYFQRESN